jgi:hypothetical protein
MRHDFDIENPKECPCDTTNGDKSSCIPRTGAFKNISKIIVAVFTHPNEISMPWPRHGYSRDWLCMFIEGFNLHPTGPVHPVPIPDRERNGRPKRFSKSDTGGNLDSVSLDFLPCPPTITALSASKICIDISSNNGKSSRESLNYGCH